MRLPIRSLLGMTLACALATPLALAEPPASAPEPKAEARERTPAADSAKTGEKTPAEVLVVLGSSQGEQVDPALNDLPALSKPPFDSFTRKQLLSKTALKLNAETPGEVDLPNGRKLRIKLLGLSDQGRYRVEVSINRPGKKDYLPVMTVAAAPGDPFFVAGQKYQDGTLIIGVRVGSADK